MASPSLQRYTQIPILTNWRQTDSVWQLRNILDEHEYGTFMNSAPLWEEMNTDDRIAAVVETRVGGLMSADLVFTAANEMRKASKLADAMGGGDRTRDKGLWERIVSHDTAKQLLFWKIGIGVAFGPIVWTPTKDSYTPRVIPWHPKYLRWDHGQRRFFVVTLDGSQIMMPDTEEEPRSDGAWFMWGGYRSWMHGLVRSLGMKYIDRAWNERDWSRRNEKYGMAITEGKYPADAAEKDKINWEEQLKNLNNEPTVMTPQRDEALGKGGYGIEIHELKGEGWQCFGDRKKSLDADIAIRVLGQELTTSTGPNGNKSLGQVHEKIRADVKKDDAAIFDQLREQVLCWYAYHNAGAAELAPYPEPQIETSTDPEAEANEMEALGKAAKLLKEAFPKGFDVEAFLEANGVPLIPEDKREPESDPPAPPLAGGGRIPGQEQPENPPSEETSDLRASRALTQLVALKAGAGTGAARKRAKYQDVQAQHAARAAAKALRPFIEKVLAAVDGGASYEEMRRLVVSEGRKRGDDVKALAKLLEQVNLLARLHGREAALASVLK